MTATLELNLSETLNADELQALTAEAVEQGKPLERILYTAAMEVARRRRAAGHHAPAEPAVLPA
jgi:hypothetical protein